MRRTAAFLSLFLLPVAGAHAVSPDPVDRPPLKAALTTCAAGPESEDRFAVFTGSMPAQRGTERMAMRFTLERRADGAKRFVRLRAPKLGRWERSLPGPPSPRGFIWSKRVEQLDPGAGYRAVIRFRWLDADGQLQRTAERTTPLCIQPVQDPAAAS
jgi:hypothetical protein